MHAEVETAFNIPLAWALPGVHSCGCTQKLRLRAEVETVQDSSDILKGALVFGGLNFTEGRGSLRLNYLRPFLRCMLPPGMPTHLGTRRLGLSVNAGPGTKFMPYMVAAESKQSSYKSKPCRP